MLLTFLAVYVVLQLALGLAVSRRVRNEEDYLVAGRSLGPALAFASVFATWFGAEACVGATGEVYAHGLGAVAADPFGYGVALIVFGVVVAGALWRAKVTTVADLFRTRFSPGVERLVALLMIPGSILWAAAQIRAFGGVVASTSGTLDLEAGLAIAAIVTVLYTSLGGLLADAWTDLIQGFVLLVGIAILAAVALDAPGAIESLRLEFARARTEPGPPFLEQLEAWAIPIVGSLFAQELAARAAAARSVGLAQRASIGAGAFYLLAGILPVSLGLLARAQLPELESPEMALPEMAKRHLGVLGQGVLAGALVSAILSTIDSALLACSALLTHNLLPALRLRGSERSRLRVARLGVVVVGGAAWFLAGQADSVHDLVEEASAFGSAGIVIGGLGILMSKRGGSRTAYGTLLAGAVAYVAGAHWAQVSIPFLASLMAAGAVWMVGALVEGSPASRGESGAG